MQNLKPNAQRAKKAIFLIWIALVINLISLGYNFLQHDFLQLAESGSLIAMEKVRRNISTQQDIFLISIAILIITAIAFIQWFRRAYYNLHQKLDYLSYPESWAAWTWFVPIIQLFHPCWIMVELYRKTKTLLSKHTSEEYRFSLSTGIVGVWWALWVIVNISGNIIFFLYSQAKNIEEYSSAIVFSIIPGIISIPLALLTIKIIKDYSKVEPTLLELND